MKTTLIDQRLDALMGPIVFSAFNRTTDATKDTGSTPNGASMLVSAAYICDGTMTSGYKFVTRFYAGSYLVSFEEQAPNADRMRVRIQNESGTQQNSSEGPMLNIGLRVAGLHTAVFYLNQGHTNLKLWIDSAYTSVSVDPGAAGIQAQTVQIGGKNGSLLKNSGAWAFNRPEPSTAQVRAMQGYMRRNTIV